MRAAPVPATLAVAGPTATGKTALAVEVALRTGAELVNADSRQVVRRLHAGTARPSAAELRGTRCHLLDEAEPGESFTAAAWTARAREVLAALDAAAVPAILVGGTGQYLRALRRGWDFPGGPPREDERAALSAAAETAAGLAGLVAELRRLDPAGAERLDLDNPRRVVRALEVRRRGNSGGTWDGDAPGRELALVVVDAERTVHLAALERRMHAMFVAGAILEETQAELSRGTAPGALARSGIGYAEALDVLSGRCGVDEASARALQRTRRYVKAQRTWFRHEPGALRAVHDGDAVAALADSLTAMVRRAGSPR